MKTSLITGFLFCVFTIVFLQSLSVSESLSVRKSKIMEGNEVDSDDLPVRFEDNSGNPYGPPVPQFGKRDRKGRFLFNFNFFNLSHLLANRPNMTALTFVPLGSLLFSKAGFG